MNKILFLLLLILAVSCSQNEKNMRQKIETSVNSDSLLIENLIKRQEFDLAKRKIDSILPLKPLNERGYYYYKKGLGCLMIEEHTQAILNFEKAISLGYRVSTSQIMIKTAKQMKETHGKYN